VDLWSRVAGREALPYVIQTEPTSARLLEATRQGRIDVAVGCLSSRRNGCGPPAFPYPSRRMAWR
jgi:hypothetical protein